MFEAMSKNNRTTYKRKTNCIIDYYYYGFRLLSSEDLLLSNFTKSYKYRLYIVKNLRNL